MTPLIDATEMYLRTVWELEEEGITPIRARLVERLGLSAPAVSETVARMEAEGLLRIAGDRTLELTAEGRRLATSVMRKHRLAELLLTEVIGLDWEHVHTEACRWEHVISDAAEARIAHILGDPSECPYGNPIPPLGPQAGGLEAHAAPPVPLMSLAEAAKNGDRVRIRRISERLQTDVEALRFLAARGLRPGAVADTQRTATGVMATVGSDAVDVPEDVAELVYVAVA